MRYIIWDFDGTLAFREGKWTGTLLEVLRRSRPDSMVQAEEIRPHLQTGFPWHHPERSRPPGLSADAWWEALIPVFVRAFRLGAKLGETEAEQLARQVRQVYLDFEQWRVFDDTVPCLEALTERGWRHVVLPNHVPELPTIIDGLGLARHFMLVFNSADMGYEKPHPQVFRNVLAFIRGAKPVWMVGDNPVADVAGAEAVGIPAILVRRPGSSAERRMAQIMRDQATAR